MLIGNKVSSLRVANLLSERQEVCSEPEPALYRLIWYDDSPRESG
jgi:hypothetical protein